MKYIHAISVQIFVNWFVTISIYNLRYDFCNKRIRIQHWRPKATDGAKFWISCKRPAFLRTFSRLQMIQNKRPWCCGAAYVEAGYKCLRNTWMVPSFIIKFEEWGTKGPNEGCHTWKENHRGNSKADRTNVLFFDIKTDDADINQGRKDTAYCLTQHLSCNSRNYFI